MAGGADGESVRDLERMAASVAAAAAKAPMRRRSASLDVGEDEWRASGDDSDNEGSRRSRRDSVVAGGRAEHRRSMSYQGHRASASTSVSRGSSPEDRGKVRDGEGLESEAEGEDGVSRRSMAGAVNAVRAARALSVGKTAEGRGSATLPKQGLAMRGAAEMVRVARSIMSGGNDRDDTEEVTEALGGMRLDEGDCGTSDVGDMRLKRKLATIEDEESGGQESPRSRSRQGDDMAVFEGRGEGTVSSGGLCWDTFEDVSERDKGVLKEFGEEVDRWQQNIEELVAKLEVAEHELGEANMRARGLMVEVQDRDDIIREQSNELIELKEVSNKQAKAIDSALYWSARAAELEVECSNAQDELTLAERDRESMSGEFKDMRVAKDQEIRALKDELAEVASKRSTEERASVGISRAISRVSLSMTDAREKRISTSSLGTSVESRAGSRILMVLTPEERKVKKKELESFRWPPRKAFPAFDEFVDAIRSTVERMVDVKEFPDDMIASNLNQYLISSSESSKYVAVYQQHDVDTTQGVLDALESTDLNYCCTTREERFGMLTMAKDEDYSTFMVRVKQAYQRMRVGVDIENDLTARRRIKDQFFRGGGVPDWVSRGLRGCENLREVVRYVTDDMAKGSAREDQGGAEWGQGQPMVGVVQREQTVEQVESWRWGEGLHPPPLMQGVFY